MILMPESVVKNVKNDEIVDFGPKNLINLHSYYHN